MSESSSVAHELLESLIDEAVTISQWDASTIAKKHDNEQTEVNSFCPCEPRVLLDVCDLVRWRCPERQLVSYSLRNSGHVELLQLKCVKQQVSGYCGHYALYFALCMLEACRSSEEERVMGHLGETFSVGAYWRRYWFSVSNLMLKAIAEDLWPWTVEYVCTGDMERSFLNYLLRTDPHIRSLHGGDKIVVVQYSYGFFQHNFSTVCEIQDKINCFRLAPGPAHLVFILGVTNHWVTLVAYKNGCMQQQHAAEGECYSHKLETADSSENRIGLVYMDSNNVPVLCYDDADIVRHIEEAERRAVEKKGKGFTDWHRAMYQQALVDQRQVVLKLAQALSGTLDLQSELVRNYMDRILDSFGSCVTKKMNGDAAMFLPLLVDWLENCHPAKSLHKTLGPMLESPHHLCAARLAQLCSWVQDNQAQLSGMEESGIQSVDKFTVVLRDINNQLKSHLCKEPARVIATTN